MQIPATSPWLSDTGLRVLSRRGATLHPPALPSARLTRLLAAPRPAQRCPALNSNGSRFFLRPFCIRFPPRLPLNKCMINRLAQEDRGTRHTQTSKSDRSPPTAEEGNLARARIFYINIFNLAKTPCTDNHMISHVSWKGIYRSQIIN